MAVGTTAPHTVHTCSQLTARGLAEGTAVDRWPLRRNGKVAAASSINQRWRRAAYPPCSTCVFVAPLSWDTSAPTFWQSYAGCFRRCDQPRSHKLQSMYVSQNGVQQSASLKCSKPKGSTAYLEAIAFHSKPQLQLVGGQGKEIGSCVVAGRRVEANTSLQPCAASRTCVVAVLAVVAADV